MKIETIRQWQFERMEYSLRAVQAMVTLVPEEAMTKYRDGGNGWTVTEVLGHLRDFEALFLERARLTVEQDNPPLPFPNPDELARTAAYQQQPWKELLNGWLMARSEHLAFLKTRSDADWERVAQHPTRGAFSLHDQLFLTTLHDSIHLEQIAHILAQKEG